MPSKDFVPDGKRRSTIDFAKKRLTGAGAAVIFVMLTTIISYLFGIVNSVTSKIFLDRILSGENHEWLTAVVNILILFAVLQLIASYQW